MLYLLVILFLNILTTRVTEGNMPKKPNIDKFLQKISQIESSGGKDTDHPTLKYGIHAGDQAIGRYALMPNTVRELVNRRKLQGTSTDQLQQVSEMSSPEMKDYIEQNPDVEDDLAKQLANKVIQRQHGDEDRAAYSWKQGHNLTPDDIPDESLEESPYVQKYRKLKGMMK